MSISASSRVVVLAGSAFVFVGLGADRMASAAAVSGAKVAAVKPKEAAAKPTTEMTWTERRAFFDARLNDTGCAVSDRKDLDTILTQLERCLAEHKAKVDAAFLRQFPDELFVIAAVEQAVAAVRAKPREFGIGAVLVKGDTIIERAHNSQLSANRTDLHAEMTLMNQYEERTKKERKGLSYDKDLRLFSSTEPCPMCLTRCVIAGVATYYGAPSDEDGMAHIKDRLPTSWAAGAKSVVTEPAKSSPKINAIASAMFYTYTRFEQFADLK